MLKSHLHIVAKGLDSTGMEHFHLCRKFYWTSLIQIWSTVTKRAPGDPVEPVMDCRDYTGALRVI